MKFLVLKRKTILAFVVFALAIVSVWMSSNRMIDDVPAFGGNKNDEKRVIHMVTGEFKTETAEGKEIEAYRWDPGTIFVEQGESVDLKILGVNGEEHPFYIEGTDLKGTVKKGAETVIPLKFEEEGTYRLICSTHEDYQHNGPMIAYIVVD